MFRLRQDSHKLTQVEKLAFEDQWEEKSMWILKWTTLLRIFCKIRFTPAVTSSIRYAP